jgi:hypothetical protein
MTTTFRHHLPTTAFFGELKTRPHSASRNGRIELRDGVFDQSVNRTAMSSHPYGHSHWSQGTALKKNSGTFPMRQIKVRAV